MEKTKFFLIRHGESEQNSEDVLSGISDIPLSKLGKNQCKAIIPFFDQNKVDLVFTTPLQRSINSAKSIFPDKKYITNENLIEINYGDYEGFPRNRYKNSKDMVIQKWLKSPSNLTFPGGDNVRDYATLIFDNLSKLAFENQGKTIACVLHRTAIRVFIAQVIGLPLDKFRQIPCSNCGISQLFFSDNQWQLDFLNFHVENQLY